MKIEKGDFVTPLYSSTYVYPTTERPTTFFDEDIGSIDPGVVCLVVEVIDQQRIVVVSKNLVGVVLIGSIRKI